MTSRSATNLARYFRSVLTSLRGVPRIFTSLPRMRGRAREGATFTPHRFNLLTHSASLKAGTSTSHPNGRSSLFTHHLSLKKATALLTTATLLSLYAFCLPRPLFNEPYSYVLLGRDGTLLSARAANDGHWRFPMRSQVPPKFEEALLRFEDKRFYSHPGVDPLALSRALYLNATHSRVVSGGSTLSMQVIRMAREDPPRTYREKLIEMVMATRLELARNKREILGLYAAHAPFGGNVVGLDAAAWRYFGRSAEQLSWAEASTLAVLPNSPALIHPGKNRQLLLAKRDRLLHALHADGRLTDLELDLALHEALPDEPVARPRHASHLLDTLASSGGVSTHRFETMLDPALQTSVEEIVQRYGRDLDKQGIRNAAVVVIDNSSFEVLAYVGNTPGSSTDDAGHAVDIVRRPRSTGSVLKPLLFAAMLEEGEILPGTLIPDLPTQYGNFMPENFDKTYRGAVPAQLALARSLNIPAVRMLKQHGVARFHAYLQQAGMTTLARAPDDYGLTLILGGAEGTLWDLSTMYANMADIAARGVPGPRSSYRSLKILRADGTVTTRMREIGPGAALLTMNALMEVNRPDLESNWKNFPGSQRVAWKTGTSFGQRDGWAIGSTARYTVGVWIGNATGEGRPDLTGVGSAAPILFAVFNRLGPSPWFRKPEADLREVEVCKDDGYLPAGGCATEIQLAPAGSHFETLSPYHRIVHLDARSKWRVNGQCETPARMQHVSWFVLPAGQEYYYRRHASDYRPLPSFRADCAADDKQSPIDFIYPNVGTRLYIPIDLAAKKGRTVFEAVHRDREAKLYWHLDDRYLGATRVFHQQALDVAPGSHVITVVDDRGNRLTRRFEVLDKRTATDEQELALR